MSALSSTQDLLVRFNACPVAVSLLERVVLAFLASLEQTVALCVPRPPLALCAGAMAPAWNKKHADATLTTTDRGAERIAPTTFADPTLAFTGPSATSLLAPANAVPAALVSGLVLCATRAPRPRGVMSATSLARATITAFVLEHLGYARVSEIPIMVSGPAQRVVSAALATSA